MNKFRSLLSKSLGSLLFLLLLIFRFPDSQDSLLVWIIKSLFEQYRRYYSFRWIHIGSLLFAAGLFFWIHRLVYRPEFRQWWVQHRWFQNMKENSTRFLPVISFLGVVIGLFLFAFVPFLYAFSYAAGLFLYFMFRIRQDTNKLFIMALLIIVLFWSAYVFNGQDSHVKIFDNLDCHFSHSKVLAESGKAFSLDPGARLDNFINGLPLAGVDSGYNVLTWLLMICPPFTAYAINDLIVRFFAFFGMFLFLKAYVIKPSQESHHWIVIGTSLCFSLLPFYPAGGLSIAGFPLLLYVILKIKERDSHVFHFLFLLFYPFYSKLALAGIFVVFFFVALFIWESVKKKRIPLAFAGAIVLLTAGFALTQFHLIHAFLNPEYISFRQEIRPQSVPAAKAFADSLSNFLFDRVNVVGAQNLFVAGAVVLALLAGVVKKFKLKNLMLLLCAVMMTSLLWGFKYWEGILSLRDRMQIINAFDFSRFYWFNPFLWSVIFALSLFVLSQMKHHRILISFFLIAQVVFLFSHYNWEFRHLLGVQKSLAGSPLTYSLSFREFYSEALFEEINEYIQIPQEDYRVVSIGIHPSIANFNGFYTLDIYTDYYPLEYKHRFRQVIAPELDKNPRLKEGFDRNAKRCYVLTSELHGDDIIRGRAYSRGLTKADQNLKLKNLELNTEVLKSMNGRYIFSGVEILNFRDNGLAFERDFERADSAWKIYLYRIL